MTEPRKIENPSVLVQWAFDQARDVQEKHQAWLTNALVDWAVSDGESMLLAPVRLNQVQPDRWEWLDYLEPGQRALAEALRERLGSLKPDGSTNGLGLYFAGHPVMESRARIALEQVSGGLWRGQLDDQLPDASFSQALHIARTRDKAALLGNDKGLAGKQGTRLILSLPDGSGWWHLRTEVARTNEALAMDHSFEFAGYNEPGLNAVSLRDKAGHSLAVLAWDSSQGLVHFVSGKGADMVDPALVPAIDALFKDLGLKGVIEAAAMPPEWVEAHRPPDEDDEPTPPLKASRSGMTMG